MQTGIQTNAKHMRDCVASNGNLDVHFHKTVNIPCFHETELWEGPGVSHPTSKKGMFFSYVPEPKYTNFQQKIFM